MKPLTLKQLQKARLYTDQLKALDTSLILTNLTNMKISKQALQRRAEAQSRQESRMK